jgi:MerR family redox-sensitive transcriptional activator SoxR
MRIGELARRVGLRSSAIRYYEGLGLLQPARRSSGRREYGDETVNRLRLLQAVQRVGFTLAETRALLPTLTAMSGPRRHWRDIAAAKLRELDETIARLQSARSALLAAVNCECAGSAEDCALVAASSRLGPIRPRTLR